MWPRYLVAMFLISWLASCGATKKQLIERASFDFNCPPEHIQVIKLDSKTRGVTACGQQATYVQMCDGSSCTWVLNSNSSPVGRPPMPPSGPQPMLLPGPQPQPLPPPATQPMPAPPG